MANCEMFPPSKVPTLGMIRLVLSPKGSSATHRLQVFYVEYFDWRDAKNAQKALGEKAFFGGRLTLYDRKPEGDDAKARARERMEHTPCRPDSPSTPTSKSTNFIPFPKSLSDQANDSDTESDVEDVQKVRNAREQVPFFDAAGRSRPRSVSAGNGNASPLNSTPSEMLTSFYSSPPLSPSDAAAA